MTRVRRDDIGRIAHTGMRTGHHLEHHGQTIWALTRDWQTPLTATGLEPGRSTTRSDPTGAAAITTDELRHAHQTLTAAITAYEAAAVDLYALLERYRPLSEKERRNAGKRINTVASCVVCDGPAPTPRRGMCQRCYRRWARHPGSTFDARLAHQREHADDSINRSGTG